MDKDSIILWLTLVMATIVVFVFAAAGLENAFTLPLLMIYGVIAVFVVLSIAGKAFSETNLACREEALGLLQVAFVHSLRSV